MTNEERRLRDRIEELEEENRQLREQLAPLVPVPCQMSKALYQLFCALDSGKTVRREALYTVLSSDPEAVDDPANLLAVQVCKLRSKIVPLGYSIENVYGVGYRMTKPPSSLS